MVQNMGRGGGGHGGGGHGGGGSHHGGGFHSSSRSHGSSFRSSGSSFSGSHHYHHHYYGGSYYYSYPRRYSSSSAGAIITAIIIFYFAVSFLSVFAGAISGFSFGSIDEDVLETQAQDYYDDKCSGREDCMLFMVAYSEKMDSEAQYIIYGDDAADVVGGSYRNFFTYYDNNYSDDVGSQIGAAIYDYYYEDLYDCEPIEPEEEFDYVSIKDEINWIDSTSYLRNNIEAFYSSTGIQLYVAVIDYDEIPGVETSGSNIKSIIAVIVAVIVILIVVIAVSSSVRKTQKKLKDLTEKAEVLNKPLDSYGAGPGGSLNAGGGIGVGGASSVDDILQPYVPNSNFGTFGMHDNNVGETSGNYKINGINRTSSEDAASADNASAASQQENEKPYYEDILNSEGISFKDAALKDLENKYASDDKISDSSSGSDGTFKSDDDFGLSSEDLKKYDLNEESVNADFKINEREYNSYDINRKDSDLL